MSEFTAAIAADPTDAVFFSNRSGAYASLKQYDLALGGCHTVREAEA